MTVTAPPKTWRPTWAEVDLGRLSANFRVLRSAVSPAKVLFVVKAGAYGHGAREVAGLAESLGADWLGVSSLEEGLALREAGIGLPTLILGSLYPFESLAEAARHRLTPTIASAEAARALAESAERWGFETGCHLKLDTGMGRIGMSKAAMLEALDALQGAYRVKADGIYTHLASAETDERGTREQLAQFEAAVSEAAARGHRFLLRHAANSAAAMRYPSARWDMVRPGLALYGLLEPFEPVLSLKTRVIFVKNVPAGARLGYGGTYAASRPSRIATLPIGYADGYPRALSNKGEVLIGGRRCPIAGAISMDMAMADVTDLPSCHVGDEAVLIGAQGDERVTAGELARFCGTIPYEIVTGLAARVPRVYVSG